MAFGGWTVIPYKMIVNENSNYLVFTWWATTIDQDKQTLHKELPGRTYSTDSFS